MALEKCVAFGGAWEIAREVDGKPSMVGWEWKTE